RRAEVPRRARQGGRRAAGRAAGPRRRRPARRPAGLAARRQRRREPLAAAAGGGAADQAAGAEPAGHLCDGDLGGDDGPAPAAGLFVESELWPNLIAAARKRGVRLALLSARMTEASAGGWGRVPRSARQLFAAFDLVLPQDAATEQRLAGLGARIGPRLNLKL